MNHGFFDEKAIVALAFFICIGLIVKFFGKSIIDFLSNKQKEIIGDIDQAENQLNTLLKTKEELFNQKNTIIQRNRDLDISTEKEKNFIIDNAKNKSEELLNCAVQNQKAVNKRVFDDILEGFLEVPFETAVKVVSNLLLEKNNISLQNQLIDNILDEALEDNFQGPAPIKYGK